MFEKRFWNISVFFNFQKTFSTSCIKATTFIVNILAFIIFDNKHSTAMSSCLKHQLSQQYDAYCRNPYPWQPTDAVSRTLQIFIPSGNWHVRSCTINADISATFHIAQDEMLITNNFSVNVNNTTFIPALESLNPLINGKWLLFSFQTWHPHLLWVSGTNGPCVVVVLAARRTPLVVASIGFRDPVLIHRVLFIAFGVRRRKTAAEPWPKNWVNDWRTFTTASYVSQGPITAWRRSWGIKIILDINMLEVSVLFSILALKCSMTARLFYNVTKIYSIHSSGRVFVEGCYLKANNLFTNLHIQLYVSPNWFTFCSRFWNPGFTLVQRPYPNYNTNALASEIIVFYGQKNAKRWRFVHRCP